MAYRKDRKPEDLPIQINVLVPLWLREKLVATAVLEDRSVSVVIRRVLEAWATGEQPDDGCMLDR